jgi:hypothetical protein
MSESTSENGGGATETLPEGVDVSMSPKKTSPQAKTRDEDKRCTTPATGTTTSKGVSRVVEYRILADKPGGMAAGERIGKLEELLSRDGPAWWQQGWISYAQRCVMWR